MGTSLVPSLQGPRRAGRARGRAGHVEPADDRDRDHAHARAAVAAGRRQRRRPRRPRGDGRPDRRRQLQRGLGQRRLRRRLRRHGRRHPGRGRQRRPACERDVVDLLGAARSGTSERWTTATTRSAATASTSSPASSSRSSSASTARTSTSCAREAGQGPAAHRRRRRRRRSARRAADGAADARDRGRPREGAGCGITPGDVRRAEATLLQGIQVGSVFEDQKVFDVVVQGRARRRARASTTCATC